MAFNGTTTKWRALFAECESQAEEQYKKLTETGYSVNVSEADMSKTGANAVAEQVVCSEVVEDRVDSEGDVEMEDCAEAPV